MTPERLTNVSVAVTYSTAAIRAYGFPFLTLLVLLGAPASFAFAADTMSKSADFDIGPQSVETALHEWSRQADVQVMVESTEVARQRTKGVRGRLSAASALTELLKETNLVHQLVGGNTVTVKRLAAATRAAPEKAAPEQKDDSREPATQPTSSVDPRESAKHSQRLRGLEEVIVVDGCPIGPLALKAS